jgi:phosphoglucosamine mutase
MGKLFGSSGIRRRVEEFPIEFIVRLGCVAGTYAKSDTIAVGRDTRASGPLFQSALVGGILSTGKNVVDVGVVTTPTLGVAAAEYGMGVMVTASHNPAEYNGFKFWDKNGAFTPGMEREIEKLMDGGKLASGSGRLSEKDFIEKHIKLITKAAGRAEGVKVLVDCGGGAGSTVTPKLLEGMGCKVTAINMNTDGVFSHPLEPTAENLAETCRIVAKGDYDVAFAHDGDADRVAVIDGKGKLIEWDTLLTALSSSRKSVATTVDASMRIEDAVPNVVRTPVGDVFVADAMKRERCEFGGEPCGAFIFPNVHLMPDGPLAAAVVANMVAKGEFYKIVGKIKSYPMVRLKIPCPNEKKQAVMEKLKKIIKEKYLAVDGIRIARKDSWTLLRPSGTEPYMRITAEGRTKKDLDEIVGETGKWLKEAMD